MRDGVAGQPARNRRFHLLAGLLAAALFLALVPAENVDAANGDSTTGIPIETVPGIASGAARTINNNGWVAVRSQIWQGTGTPVDIVSDFPAGSTSVGIGDLNDSGEAVGTYDDAAGSRRGFFWSSAGFADAGDPPGAIGTWVEVFGMAENGSFAGRFEAELDTCANSDTNFCGFYGAAPGDLQVVPQSFPGGATDTNNTRVVGAGWTWPHGGTLEPLDGIGVSISEEGHIAGATIDFSEAAYWSDHTATAMPLGTLGGSRSQAWSVNNNGEVVGWGHTADGYEHAFYWSESTGMVDLGTLSDDHSSIAYDINDVGQVVGESWGTSGGSTPVIWDVTSLGGAPPVLDSIGDRTATVGVELAFTAAATSEDPAGPHFEVFGATESDPAPGNATINPATGQFTWTPGPEHVGDNLITFTVSDAYGSDSETITVDVTEPPTTISIDVVESIIVDDSPLVALAVAILIQEGITVIDNVDTDLAVELFIVEDVTVSDDPSVHPPIEILVTEDIIVEDLVDVHPPVVINIGEEITVADTATSELSVMIFVTETLGVVDTVTINVTDNTGSITGTKWADTDNNGARNPGEPGLAGVTVYADLNDNGALDTGEPSTLTLDDDPATLNLETGRYTLDALDPGDYVIREVVPNGYIQTYPTGDGSHDATVTAGADIVGIDFGNHLPPNLPPVIAPIDDVVVDEGQEVTIVPQVIDPEGDSYTIGWDGVPPGSITNGVFPYTPPEEHGPGQYLVTVTATQDSNPANSDSETFLITVNEVDGPPVEVPTVPGDVGAGSAASGDTVVVSGTGYLPGTGVTVLLFSDPAYLDTSAVGSDGTFQTTVTIPADTSPGLHRIVVVGLEGPYDGLVTINWILVVPPDTDCTIVGTEGDDWLRGTSGDDVICGLGGNDFISGRRGDDIILAGEGNDLVLGGAGDDLISGGQGNDALFGNRHDDVLEGGPGFDLLTGGGGADSYVAPEPVDVIVGVWSNDQVLE